MSEFDQDKLFNRVTITDWETSEPAERRADSLMAITGAITEIKLDYQKLLKNDQDLPEAVLRQQRRGRSLGRIMSALGLIKDYETSESAQNQFVGLYQTAEDSVQQLELADRADLVGGRLDNPIMRAIDMLGRVGDMSVVGYSSGPTLEGDKLVQGTESGLEPAEAQHPSNIKNDELVALRRGAAFIIKHYFEND